ncbi:periplasmic mercuric ion binding protein [Lebetimonas natsushimae]|uniref:Periplasmic mercuric ion binding protein n=1 Tax=Lebetimonas natsushimae TaxID=1936991 RepID=A0A292YCG0_9BACT|nr:heavy metal-associated domain-containing protein [Lebetimonas natsushimae]GAX87179.1 periplasmic mercuric ion binding protein [Lebetimonas natsushimae]
MKKIFLSLILLNSLFSAEKVAIIQVSGMTCPLCTTAIKRSLKMTPGVIKAKVLLHTKTAAVIFDNTKTTPKKLLHAIEVVGYKGKIQQIKEVK